MQSLNRTTLAALFLISAPLHAETALERVLLLVENNPELAQGHVYLNVSSQAPDALSDGGRMIDSSIHYHQPPSDHETDPPEPLDLHLKATAIGATNTGSIRAMVAQSMSNGGLPPDSLMVLTANAAATQSPVFADISLTTNTPLAESSELSTSAIGSVNTGDIKILIDGSAGD